jgi:hypothetical protein
VAKASYLMVARKQRERERERKKQERAKDTIPLQSYFSDLLPSVKPYPLKFLASSNIAPLARDQAFNTRVFWRVHIIFKP